jgi:dTDP-4-dehydrorhamnose reductase
MEENMKKILVTGCNGQLGRAIRKEYANDEVEFINTDVVEGDGVVSLDITDVDAVLKLVRETKPEVIINCAAHTNVDKCEEQWDLAYKINAIGPRNLSIAATEQNAKMIHVSTDYVFEGNGTAPYTEFDDPNPVSAYGKTKLEGERFVKQFAAKHFILRTAWLYGDGKNFVKTMLALSENHEELSVVCDQKGSPTSAVELAKMIHYLEPTDNYGLFHATCEGDTNWADFTEEIFRKAGKSTKVNHVTSKQYAEMNPASAKRPAYSILENYMIKLTSDYRMADWHDALDVYLKELLKK